MGSFVLPTNLDKANGDRSKHMQKKEYHFSGHHVGHVTCQNEGPHAPHIVGYYNTVRHGKLERFCRGKSGEGIQINEQEYAKGSAATPAYVKGEYWED